MQLTPRALRPRRPRSQKPLKIEPIDPLKVRITAIFAALWIALITCIATLFSRNTSEAIRKEVNTFLPFLVVTIGLAGFGFYQICLASDKAKKPPKKIDLNKAVLPPPLNAQAVATLDDSFALSRRKDSPPSSLASSQAPSANNDADDDASPTVRREKVRRPGVALRVVGNPVAAASPAKNAEKTVSWDVVYGGKPLTEADLSHLGIVLHNLGAHRKMCSVWRVPESDCKDVLFYFSEWQRGSAEIKRLAGDQCMYEIRRPTRDSRILGVDISAKGEPPLIVWLVETNHARLIHAAKSLTREVALRVLELDQHQPAAAAALAR